MQPFFVGQVGNLRPIVNRPLVGQPILGCSRLSGGFCPIQLIRHAQPDVIPRSLAAS